MQMVFEIREQTGQRGGALPCLSVATQLGMGVESLRLWVNQAEVDGGQRPGTTTADAVASPSSSSGAADPREPSGLETAHCVLTPPDQGEEPGPVEQRRSQEALAGFLVHGARDGARAVKAEPFGRPTAGLDRPVPSPLAQRAGGFLARHPCWLSMPGQNP